MRDLDGSAIITINGEDVNEYLEQPDLHNGLQDLDSQYNQVFFNPATAILGAAVNARGSFYEIPFLRHDDSIECTFKNGSSHTLYPMVKFDPRSLLARVEKTSSSKTLSLPI